MRIFLLSLIVVFTLGGCVYPVIRDTRAPTPVAVVITDTVPVTDTVQVTDTAPPLTITVPVIEPAPCLIKGNINRDGKKIYHMPGQLTYSQTQIDQSKGEKYFCTEENAKAAGWVKAGK